MTHDSPPTAPPQGGAPSADWGEVRSRFDAPAVRIGPHWFFNLLNDPKRLGFVLSRYKFAAKMIPSGSRILELGCSDGVGIPILAENAGAYTGVDLDEEAVEVARANWEDERTRFAAVNFLDRGFGEFDAVVSLDVIEHIEPAHEERFLKTVWGNLGADGMCVVGTPCVTSEAYASEASRLGHVNLYDAGRLRAGIGRIFHNVFIFSMNDEVVHTGFTPMAHYLLALGCFKREEFA